MVGWLIVWLVGWLVLCSVVSGPHQIVDFYTTDAEELCVLFAKAMVSCYQNYMPLINDVTVVVSPEHYDTFLKGECWC